jgi:transcriptional regulator with XRE-family HTH domain
MTAKNSVPRLLKAIRMSLGDVAKQAGVTRGSADFWRAGRYQPAAAQRTALVKAVRAHATRLLELADAVEREGETRELVTRKTGRR